MSNVSSKIRKYEYLLEQEYGRGSMLRKKRLNDITQAF
jgi:hypothetical protein